MRIIGKYHGSLGILFVYERSMEVWGEAIEGVKFCIIRKVVLEVVG